MFLKIRIFTKIFAIIFVCYIPPSVVNAMNPKLEALCEKYPVTNYSYYKPYLDKAKELEVFIKYTIDKKKNDLMSSGDKEISSVHNKWYPVVTHLFKTIQKMELPDDNKTAIEILKEKYNNDIHNYELDLKQTEEKGKTLIDNVELDEKVRSLRNDAVDVLITVYNEYNKNKASYNNLTINFIEMDEDIDEEEEEEEVEGEEVVEKKYFD